MYVGSHKRGAYLVQYLVAGSQNSCVHYFHCTRDSFVHPDAAIDYREYILGRLKLPLSLARPALISANVPATVPAKKTTLPRVTIVHRTGSRRFANLEEITSTMRLVLGDGAKPEHVRVVDFARLNFDQQYAISYATDILIMVHGGALANMLYLPAGATLIDIYPYSFTESLHGLVTITLLI